MSMEALLYAAPAPCVKRARMCETASAQPACPDTESDGDEAMTPAAATEEDDLYGWARLGEEYQIGNVSPLLAARVPPSGEHLKQEQGVLPAPPAPVVPVLPIALSPGIGLTAPSEGAMSWFDLESFTLDGFLAAESDAALGSPTCCDDIEDDVFGDLPALPRSSSLRSTSSASSSSADTQATLGEPRGLPETVGDDTPAPVSHKVSVTLKRCTCGCWERVYASSMQTALLMRRPVDAPQVSARCPNGVLGALAFDCPFTIVDVIQAIARAEFAEMPMRWSLRPERRDGCPGEAICWGQVEQCNQAYFIHVREE